MCDDAISLYFQLNRNWIVSMGVTETASSCQLVKGPLCILTYELKEKLRLIKH